MAGHPVGRADHQHPGWDPIDRDSNGRGDQQPDNDRFQAIALIVFSFDPGKSRLAWKRLLPCCIQVLLTRPTVGLALLSQDPSNTCPVYQQ